MLISKSFESVYNPKVPSIKVVPGFTSDPEQIGLSDFNEQKASGGYDFSRLQEQIRGQRENDKQELDVNISLDGMPKEARISTKNRSRSRVKIDTGRIMVGT